MSSPQRRVLADAAVVLGVAVLYVACAKLGLALAVHADEVSAVWPPTGFALAALMLLGRRAIPGIFMGAFAANAATGEPLWVAAGVGVGNTLEAFVGAWILNRLRFDAALARLRDVVALFAAVTVAPLVSATIGVAFLIAGGLHPASVVFTLWPVWWLGDALGGLVIAPLILVWSRRDQLLRSRGRFEPVLMLAGILVVAGAIFSLPPYPFVYLIFPFLIWAALRLGPAYTTTASLLANTIAIIGTLSGHGPFAGGGPERGLILVQVFMAAAASTALILGAVAAQSRLAHQRAEVSEERLRMAMAGARVGVWEWNIGSGEITWSEGLEPLHGLPKGGFAGTYATWRTMIHPDDVERVEALITRSVESRRPYEAEFRLIGPDGVVRWTGARGIVLEDGNGRPARMVGVGIDVTGQKELEEELRRQHRRKDEFLAMLAHELRNPLAAIVHAADLLDNAGPAETEMARGVIRRQTGSLSRLVDDLLDVSRITRGQITLERKQVPLADVVTAGVEVWRHLIAQKKQHLSIDVPGALWVDGDSTRLTQALANVVHNAAKFTPEHGAIEISATEEDGSAVLRVRDDGRGISGDVLAHAFELFVQGPPGLDRKQGGLGLGLTLVRRLVEMHGGSVEARSDGVDRGCEIIMRLPLTADPAPSVAEVAPVKVAPTSAKRVLVVEDNADARAMLVLLMKRAGHHVRAVGDGPAALKEAQSFAPEIVLVDVGLPGLDGYEVARELRGSSRTAEALLVAFTGYGQAEDVARAVAAGFDHHLLKPADPAQVLAVIAQERRDGDVGGDRQETRS